MFNNGQYAGYPFQQQHQYNQQPCQTYGLPPPHQYPYQFEGNVQSYQQNGLMHQQYPGDGQMPTPFLIYQQPPQPQIESNPMYQPPPPQIQPNPMYGFSQHQQQQYPPLYQIQPTPIYVKLPEIPRITEELSKNLDPEYSKELDNLYMSLSNVSSKEEIETLLSGFAKNYLLLPFLWKYRLQLTSRPLSTPSVDEKQLAKNGLYDFYSIDAFLRYQNCFKCFDKTFLSDWRRSTWDTNHFGQVYDYVMKAKEGLFFPHENLLDVYKFYEAHSDDILLQHDYLKYKKALYHSHRIIAATSLRELFCCYTQIDDPKVVIQNVELLIAQNPTCQWLWKSYLQFLRDRQPKHGLYDLPKHSFRFHNSLTFKNAYEQKYSLPPTLIKYMLKKASAKQLNALFETCKQLFLLQPTPICCNLTVTNLIMYDNIRSPCWQQSFKFSSFVPWELQNIFLVKSLTIESPKPSTMLSAIVGKLSRCEIWSLNVKGQTIFLDELKFLLESGNVEKFVFTGGYITVGYGQMASIEDVVAMLPKAHTVILDSAAFTSQTFSTLSSLNRTTKFKEFTIEKVTSCFRIFDFEYFVMKHAASNSIFTFVFESFTPNDFVKKFNNFVKRLFQDWSPIKIKPRICIRKMKK
uniref:Uncharacterized protein n=1 Tax=Panagrolaimus sp. ES5 TaxID=591445 RepID=A0AC34F2B3_9BILA